ncbi:MAG: 50S ribosomal protein L4 [Deltaproteobacteria bacterium]|nr:50S ribosomal protein L4 [Deltaproteobacteria bacterium]
MTVINVYNLEAEKISEMEISDEVFNVEVKKHLLHQVVVGQLHNRRQGSASTKGRSEVSSSGKKLWRQKGTGRARVGSASSPTRRGGGVVFGPTPRNYTKKIPKKMRKAALNMALSDKFMSDRMLVLEDFNLPEIKTKRFMEVMRKFNINKALIVVEARNENLEKSSRNVPWVKVMRHEGINVYDILNHDHLIMARSAIAKVEEALIS